MERKEIEKGWLESGTDVNGALESGITVDAEGDWYFQGNRIIRENIIEYFCENVEITPEGGFVIVSGQNRCSLKATDTPFVVTGADRSPSGTGNEPEKIILRFKHLSWSEPLDAGTLKVGKDNVLYCRIRGGRFPARFSRAAYYRFAEWIEEDSEKGRFFIALNGIRHFIPMEQTSMG